jgi:hypothetical protein
MEKDHYIDNKSFEFCGFYELHEFDWLVILWTVRTSGFCGV